MRIFRNGLFRFAPDGFLERIRVQAHDSHPHHDRRYVGSFPRPMLDSQGIPIADRFLENRLTPLIKHQFEPILANDLQPVPDFVREVSQYLGKSTGKVTFCEYLLVEKNHNKISMTYSYILTKKHLYIK